MSLPELHKRYLNIVNSTLMMLKDKGFEKKGKNHLKHKGELILKISHNIPRPTFNSEKCYQFEVICEVLTTKLNFVQLYMLIENEKNLTSAPVISCMIVPNGFHGTMPRLSIEDPLGRDEQLITEFKEKLENEILMWFDTVTSFGDIIHIAEVEAKVAREKRTFFSRVSIHRILTNLYAAMGWKEKSLEMFEKYLESTPAPARHLVEKDKKKYITYLDSYKI